MSVTSTPSVVSISDTVTSVISTTTASGMFTLTLSVPQLAMHII